MNRLKWNEGDSQISKEYDWDVALGIKKDDLELCRTEHLWIVQCYSPATGSDSYLNITAVQYNTAIYI